MASKYSDPEFEYYQNILNKQNTASAKSQMDFQKMMSDTSHQREVKDLLKAGLNPVLSANNGASTPSGSYANVDSTALSSRTQQKINKQNIDAQLKMQKLDLENAYKIAQLQAAINLEASKYASNMNYEGAKYSANSAKTASMYGANTAYDAAIYGYDTSASNTQLQVQESTKGGLVKQGYKYLTGKEWDSNSGRTLASDTKSLWNKGKQAVTNWIQKQKNQIVRVRESNKSAKNLAKSEKKTKQLLKNARDANVRANNILNGKTKTGINIKKTNTNTKNKMKNK